MIELKNIYKLYEMGGETVTALEDVSLSIQKGDFTSIMGPSGSGKSTLMNVTGLLDEFDRGEYLLNEHNIGDYSDKELAKIRNKEIGFVFQSFNLMPRMSVLENVMLPLVYGGVSLSDRKERATEALEKVGLGDRVDHRPNEISGGQKQRVAIARAIVNQPTVILADEPTGNLDSTTAEEIIRIFQELNRDGATIVMVTHEREVAEYTKKIIHLRDGRLTEEEEITPISLLGGDEE
ncbi:MAG TPA: ABC transporter ATP-binding protein [Atopostipes sp.]|nr:ABC transporter ATP-binding protein [Atopostipes sp.]